MSPKQYQKLLKRFIDDNFNTYKEAAKYFRCSPTTITLVLQEDRSPNKAMLAATGYTRVEVNKVSYIRSAE